MSRIPTPNRASLARFCALTLAALATLAVSATTLGSAGAASSGGIGASDGADAEEETTDESSAGDKYTRLWADVSGKDRRWARDTAECESGRDPDAIGGGGIYRGAFQFMKSTWKASPKSPGGDPIDHPYRTQAVVAVALKNRDGADHWPVCG